MYLWQRLASQKWRSDNENELRAIAGNRVAIIEEAGRKKLRFEVAARFRTELQNLTKQFGGRVEKLPRDWLTRFSRKQKTKPLKIGKRLIVVRSPKDQSLIKRLIIPAGAAFGTGEHATTAMSLRLLERLTRNWKPGWSIVDLGTGTGILALAAKCFGANPVIGIDNDPVAIAAAKGNARLNKIPAVQFRVGDVYDLKFPRGNRPNYRGYRGQVDIVTANLFSELLVEIVPKLKATRWMILSGILRSQERDVSRALRRHKIDVSQVRRHGKWVAILTAVR